MIGYCPLEEEPPVQHPKRVVRMKPTQKVTPRLEECECNYLVMFFIVGVLILAVTDSMQK